MPSNITSSGNLKGTLGVGLRKTYYFYIKTVEVFFAKSKSVLMFLPKQCKILPQLIIVFICELQLKM